MKGAKVSVCVPNYNNAQYLEQCLLSAVNQEYDNFEVIFVDDCSTDNSLPIAKDIAKKFPDKVFIYSNENNIGQPKNTNKALKLCNGEYVVILHSDDCLLPNFLNTLVPILHSNSALGMAVGERLETNESGDVDEITPFYDVNCIVPGEMQAKVFMMMSFLPCQVLFRKSTFNLAGGVDEQHVVNLDGLLWFKCALNGDVAYVRTAVSIYRVHANSTTAAFNRTIDHMLEYYNTLKKMFEYGKSSDYLKLHFDDAAKRIGSLTVRYCYDVMKEENFELARQYLALATVFDPSITKNKSYQFILACLNSDNTTEMFFELLNENSSKRMTSYRPPEGFILL